MGQICHSEHVEVKRQSVEVYSLPFNLWVPGLKLR